jgi:regulation of enolase protein 1 (concanavalin A-like superfamily)
VALFARADGSVELTTRASSGAQTTLVVGTTQAAPAWLRLVRNGSTVTASVSANGTTWRKIGSARLSVYSSSSVGLAVTSGGTTLRNTSTFDRVTVR